MFLSDPASNTYTALFGNSCANSPHLAGHLQETGTGDKPLPLRDYVALNNTLDELIVFGNQVALKQPGWIINPDLLPPNLVEPNRMGVTAAQLKAQLIGTIVSGTAYSRAEVYKSAVITSPLQIVDAAERLYAMNRALGDFSAVLRTGLGNRPFTPLEPMPGNSFDSTNSSVCWTQQ